MEKDQSAWDEHIPEISCALRNSVHQSLKCAPYQASYRFNMITHGSQYKLLRNLGLLEENVGGFRKEDQLQLLRKQLKANMKNAYEQQAEKYNLRTKEVNFKVGQEVYRGNFLQSSFEKGVNAKLAPMFIKSRVREKQGNSYYILEDLQGKLVETYHAKDIRP